MRGLLCCQFLNLGEQTLNKGFVGASYSARRTRNLGRGTSGLMALFAPCAFAPSTLISNRDFARVVADFAFVERFWS